MQTYMDTDDDSESNYSWISWFCEERGNDFFCEISREYIIDNFNIYGLDSLVANYTEALSMVLGPAPSNPEDYDCGSLGEIYRSAVDLYGLTHARFITTPKGLAIMKEKFEDECFESCPRLLCEEQQTLPIGLSNELNKYQLMVYCPKCEDIYHCKEGPVLTLTTDIDGAFFGTAFPHMLLQAYPSLVPSQGSVSYIPRIYGLSLIHICRCRRYAVCRSRWSPYH
eukprot:TRINITY_DN5866_c0_g1_i9.p1 TRINITY_DN5866_c0_g1~~TRINITY_DN5866_c0_g1_i9.p1  ORF type:complete len:225 (+),score=32.19 TRINITY_DN5866_c0_g1_i9:101-775(+)